MIENREFYSSLRTASIKLIPKKVNCSKISNWRPISLLSCIYKIFSKAYTQRLKKVIDKLTSNSQKAYSSTKVISEAILNILEYTKKAEIEGKNLALLAINFKKAFDSVSHEYLLEILRFYNI